ncbi:MAG: DUF2949 domain-containing protein [Cyanobacteria bacterium P01_F01_bin.150]
MVRSEGTEKAKLIQFLQEDLAISPDAIAVAMRQSSDQPSNLLPMVLWQYGLITIEQLDRVFEWLEAA